MRPARYIGDDRYLEGKSALVRQDPYQADCVLAQFDEVGLKNERGESMDRGWHCFAKAHFVTLDYA